MKARFAIGLALIVGVLGTAGASTAAADQSCAPTAASPSPTSPTAGHACWVNISPYPFGFDGNPVNATSGPCATQPPGPTSIGANKACYLQVNSMAFRAWNRGLASVTPAGGGNTPYGVWLYNGSRWFPDPTFPGTSVCKGNTVLWAGKLDYWLVGDATLSGSGAPAYWPALCRFDRIADEWEPLSIPKAALDQVPLNPTSGAIQPGAITSGACQAWDNCWFFGTYGMVLHWDGAVLTVSSVGLFGSPWLKADYTAATAATGADGNPFSVAVAAATTGLYGGPGPQLAGGFTPSQPNGAPGPQVVGSDGGGVGPLSYTAPSAPAPATPYPLDLNAVAFDSAGHGWVAANPSGSRPNLSSVSTGPTHVAPLFPISSAGTALPCPGTPIGSFMSSSYAWGSVGVFPDGGAMGGGQFAGPDGEEPVLAQVSCASGAKDSLTEFRAPDPTTTDPSAPLIPANENGTVTAVAVDATNDAWSSTSGDQIGVINTFQPPHLYELTDGQPPNAPAGNDQEKRPNTLQQSPPVYIPSPTVTVKRPPKARTKRKIGANKHLKLPSPIYSVHLSSLIPTGSGTFDLDIRFKVRRAVKLGAEALRGKRVVAASGMRSFHRGNSGVLVLHLSTTQWPTSLKFVLPKVKKK